MLQTLQVSPWLRGWYPLHWGRRRSWSAQTCWEKLTVMMIIKGLQSIWRACAQSQVVPKQQNPGQTNRQCPHTREVLSLIRCLDWIQILIYCHRNGRHSLTLLNIDTNSIGEYKWALEKPAFHFVQCWNFLDASLQTVKARTRVWSTWQVKLRIFCFLSPKIYEQSRRKAFNQS